MFLNSWEALNQLLIRGLSNPLKLMRLTSQSPDLHSFLRITAAKKVFRKCAHTVDVGAGEGWFSIELSQCFNSPILSLAYSEEQYRSLKRNVEALGVSDLVSTGRDDAQTLASVRNGSADQILLLDVLEHVEEEASTLKAVNRVLKLGGRLVLSVPTPFYPEWFGDDFDKTVGHKRHYTVDALKGKLLSHGFMVQDFFYYTSGNASKFMKMCYNDLHIWPGEFSFNDGYGLRERFKPVVSIILLPILAQLSMLFESYDRRLLHHSSLLVLAVKVENA